MQSSVTHQVFIACNLPELTEELELCRRILAKEGFLVTGFGMLAKDQQPELSSNLGQLKVADYCLVLQGQTYGQLSDNGVGMVHRLYSQAKASRIPVACLIQNDTQSNPNPLDRKRVDGFCNQLRTQQHSFYQDLNDFEQELLPLIERLKQQPRPGWARADQTGTTQASHPEQQGLLQQVELLQRSLQKNSRELLDAMLIERRVEGHLNISFGLKKYEQGNVQVVQDHVRLSWPHILQLLGPTLTTPSNDASIYAGFCQRLLEFIHGTLVSKYPRAHAFVHLKIKPSDFDKIKTLGYSLGLMTNLSGLWALTPFGTEQMAQLQTSQMR